MDFRTSISDGMKAYVLLINERKMKAFPWAWWAAVGALVAGRGFPPLFPSVVIVVAMLLIAISVYIYNNVTDLEMDKLNPIKVNRPLPSGAVTTRQAMSLVYIFGAVGIALTFLTNLTTILLVLLYISLAIFYSHPRIRFKNRFVLKEFTMAIGCFLAVLIGSMATGMVNMGVIFSGTFLFAIAMVASITFIDVPDMEEDRKYGVKTLTMLFKWKTKVEMMIIAVLILMTLTPLTYVNLGFNTVFPIIVIIACLIFLRQLFPLLNKFDNTRFWKGYKWSYRFFILVNIAAILGSLPLNL